MVSDAVSSGPVEDLRVIELRHLFRFLKVFIETDVTNTGSDLVDLVEASCFLLGDAAREARDVHDGLLLV